METIKYHLILCPCKDYNTWTSNVFQSSRNERLCKKPNSARTLPYAWQLFLNGLTQHTLWSHINCMQLKWSARDAGKRKWPIITWWIVCHVWYNFSNLFWYIIRLWNWWREKRKKSLFISIRKKKKRRREREREREKRSICVHRESNPNEQIQSPKC